MVILRRKRSSPEGSDRSADSNAAAVVAHGDKFHTQAIDYYAQREQGRAHVEFLPLPDIDLDPTNPRSKGLDDVASLIKVLPNYLAAHPELEQHLVIDPNHTNYKPEVIADFDQIMQSAVEQLCQSNPERQADWTGLFDRLNALRDNIRVLGVKQDIEVMREGKRYRIVFGHRRFLASILAGEINIPAHIKGVDSHGVKHTQASENLLQEGMMLAQRLEAIDAALADYGLGPSSNRSEAARILGIMDRTSLTRYMTILEHGSSYLRQLITTKAISDYKLAAKLAKLKDSEIKKLLENEGQVSPQKKKKPVGKKKAGRPSTYIKTPKIKDPGVIALILEQFGEQGRVHNWNDKDEVNVEWAAFIENLEKQCQKGG